MEAEDRQALRRERKRQKDKKVRRIVWIVLAVLLAAIVILKLCEVDFGSLRGGAGGLIRPGQRLLTAVRAHRQFSLCTGRLRWRYGS